MYSYPNDIQAELGRGMHNLLDYHRIYLIQIRKEKER